MRGRVRSRYRSAPSGAPRGSGGRDRRARSPRGSSPARAPRPRSSRPPWPRGLRCACPRRRGSAPARMARRRAAMRYPSGAGLPRATSSPETTVSNAPQSPTASQDGVDHGPRRRGHQAETEPRLAEARAGSPARREARGPRPGSARSGARASGAPARPSTRRGRRGSGGSGTSRDRSRRRTTGCRARCTGPRSPRANWVARRWSGSESMRTPSMSKRIASIMLIEPGPQIRRSGNRSRRRTLALSGRARSLKRDLLYASGREGPKLFIAPTTSERDDVRAAPSAHELMRGSLQ